MGIDTSLFRMKKQILLDEVEKLRQYIASLDEEDLTNANVNQAVDYDRLENGDFVARTFEVQFILPPKTE
jgi:predicted transcriptional regulator